jgi:hypothetical protein
VSRTGVKAGITPLVPKPLTSGAKAEGRFGKQDFGRHDCLAEQIEPSAQHDALPADREGRNTDFDDGVKPLGCSAIQFQHLGDLREHVVFAARLARAARCLQLFCAIVTSVPRTPA